MNGQLVRALIAVAVLVGALLLPASHAGAATSSTNTVVLEYLTATGTQNGVTIDWATVSETNILGFNILRSTYTDNLPEVISPEMIMATGATGGGVYSFEDTTAAEGRTYAYWLEAVGTYGATIRFGPITATRPHAK